MRLSQAVINDTYTDEFVLHVFVFPIASTDDWRAAETRMLEAANSVCAEYLDEAREHFDRLRGRHALENIAIEPRVTLRIPDPTRIELITRIPTPERAKGRMEQAILRRYLTTASSHESGKA